MDTAALLVTLRDGTLTREAAQALTAEQWSAHNASGNTPVHAAAKYGRLRDLPAHVLTAELLTLKNDSGYTPLHHLAYGGHLYQLPRGLLARGHFLIRSNSR